MHKQFVCTSDFDIFQLCFDYTAASLTAIVCTEMELLTASPTDALSQAPRPVTVGVCSFGAVHGPPRVGNLSGSCRVRMLSSFMQVQTTSSALRCTIRPGVSFSQMLLCCCRTSIAFVACIAEPFQLDKATRTSCLLCQEVKSRDKSIGLSQQLASATLTQTTLSFLFLQVSIHCTCLCIVCA